MAVLSLNQLGALSLWRDEVASVVFAQSPVEELLRLADRNRDAAGLANMATYYLLLHYWLSLGDSEAHIRLLSVLFGVASVIPVYFIGRRLGGWGVGLLAAAIYALIPYAIHYSQDARGYSLAMLLAGLLSWLVLIGLERRSLWPWALYGVVAALGLYVHFFLGLTVAAHGAWLLGTRQVPPWRASLLALSPIVLAAAPLPFIIGQFGAEQEWIPPLSWAHVGRETFALAGGPLLLIAFSALGAIAVVLRHRDPRTWLLVACVVLPVAAATAVSVVKPLYMGRYLIVVLPTMAVLAAAGVAALPRPVMRAGAIGLLAALLLMALPTAYADQHQQDWRSASQWIATAAEPGDQIVARSGRRPILYYLERAAPATIPAAGKAGVAIDDLAVQRVWLLVDATDSDPALRLRLERSFHVVERREFGHNLSVLLMSRAPATAEAIR